MDHSKIHPRYLYSWLCGREFWLQASGVKSQTDMADYVSLSDQRRFLISLPSIDEQKGIGDLFGALDDKIELNRRMNRTLEAMAQAIFKSWFVDFDPIVAKADGRKPYGMDDETAALFSGGFQESKLGPIPKGWNPSTVGHIARYINGKNFTKDASGNGRLVIRIAELNSGPTGSTVYSDIHASHDNIAYPGDLLLKKSDNRWA